jgi:glycosyltransferase involved in cell wall biosynthesis
MRLCREPTKEQYVPELHRQPENTVISLLPVSFPWKIDFVNMFSQELSRQGYTVREFRWRSFGLQRTNFVFLHWPDEFFVNKGKLEAHKSFVKLAVIHIAKILWRTKLVWVAHNAAPHDTANLNSRLRRWFLRSLDGIVFLSESSRKLIGDLYPDVRTCNSLVTVHGHYRGTRVTHETPCLTPRGDIQLLHFGMIRPYKNVEALVDAVSSISSGIHLLVAGMVVDRALCAAIQAKAKTLPHVMLDFRDAPISDAELETIVDSADAIVLPYKNILNSGAALFSLSRNRPVLAPNVGSLPELRDAVGQEWVYLYDGEFSRHVLVKFREWMLTTKRPRVAPLDVYELSRIGRDLRRFIESMNR